jgi:hypothetical protein
MRRINLRQRPGTTLNRTSPPRSSIGTPGNPTATKAGKRMMDNQKRCQGVPFTAPAGASLVNNINLPGDARLFLGLIFTSGAGDQDTFNLTLNNNLIIDNAAIALHDPQMSGSITSHYFPYNQPLTGKDIFNIAINSVAGFSGVLEIHYI